MRRELCKGCSLQQSPIKSVARGLLSKSSFDATRFPEDANWLNTQDNQQELESALGQQGERRCHALARILLLDQVACPEASLVGLVLDNADS